MTARSHGTESEPTAPVAAMLKLRPSLVEAHLGEVASLIGRLDSSAIHAVARLLELTNRAGRKVFLFGNGGSAATAAHFATDLAQVAGIRAMCLATNTIHLSAIANDHGYDMVFERQLERWATGRRRRHRHFGFRRVTQLRTGASIRGATRWHHRRTAGRRGSGLRRPFQPRGPCGFDGSPVRRNGAHGDRTRHGRRVSGAVRLDVAFPMSELRWWPFGLPVEQQSAVDRFTEMIEAADITLDLRAYERTLDALDLVMAGHIDNIISRDGLPHHAHLINGWGNAVLRDGSRLVDGLAPFVHHGAADIGVILQKHSEGEVHPWQSLAYALMAGADPDAPIGDTDHTIRSVAAASRWLLTDEGEELGHLLYGLARLGDDASDRPFILSDFSEVGLEGLVAMSVRAHISGHFEVCRKAHLTEGICAAVARFDQLRSMRPVASSFLKGQISTLLLLGVIAEQVGLRREGAPGNAELVGSMQKTLALGPLIENHFYWAGHVMEIAGLAMIDGFELSAQDRKLMIFVANELNLIAAGALAVTDFPTSFLHFGHYRRGVTLLAAAEAARSADRQLTVADLPTYSADFQTPKVAPDDDGPSEFDHPYFLLADSPPGPSARLLAVLDAYRAITSPGFELRGGFPHFRRVLPAGWPRSVHYEMLETEGGSVTADLHFESPSAAELSSGFEAEVAAGALRDQCPDVVWDPSWYDGLGRLQLARTPEHPDELARDFKAMIGATFPLVDQGARRVTVPAHPDHRVQ